MEAALGSQRYLAAVLAGDRRQAQRVVAEARSAGMDLRGIYLDVLQPALREVGELWLADRITVAEEHLATAITQTVMAQLYGELFDQAREEPVRSLIAACADVERHEMGLRMVCDLLELAGWDTTYLGATVPTRSLVEMVRERRPDAVAISAALVPHLPRLGRMIEALRAGLGEEAPLIMVGGRPFIERPELAQQLGADLTAKDAAAAVDLLRETFP